MLRLLAAAAMAALGAAALVIAPAGAQAILFLEPEHLSTTEILGREVHRADGSRLGRIRDLLVDLRTRKVEYLALEGGAYPVSALRSGEGLQLLLQPEESASGGASAPSGVVPLSTLVGRVVYDSAGQVIGRIRHLAVNALDGTVDFAVVEAAADGALLQVPLQAVEHLLSPLALPR